MVFGQTNTGFNNRGFNNGNSFGNAGAQQQNAVQSDNGLMSLSAMIQGGGAKAFFTKNSQPGDMIEGEIVSVEAQQVHVYNSTMIDTWPDGRAKQQIRIIIQTSLPPEDDTDDGRRSIYVKGWGVQLKALRDACREANVKEPAKGDMFAARFAGFGQQGKAPQPPKVYEYRIIPQSQAAVSGLLNEPAPQQAMPQQPVQQTPQVQQSAPVASQQPVQQSPAISASQVQSMLNMGKTVQDIAGFLGVTVAQVEAVLPPTMGQDGNPVF